MNEWFRFDEYFADFLPPYFFTFVQTTDQANIIEEREIWVGLKEACLDNMLYVEEFSIPKLLKKFFPQLHVYGECCHTEKSPV